MKKYGLLLRENYSSTAANNYQWIYQLIIIFSIASSITIFKNIVRYFEAIKLLAIAEFISHFIPLAFIVWIVFNALKKPYLFQAIESTLKLSKSKKIKANNEESLEKLDKLKEFMNENKPYLDPLLSIDSLSNQMNTSSTELSLLINQHLGEHFFNFVNRYRISYAQELLVDPQRKNLTVAEIMYDSGFNSKSSFFTAFKKQTGKTPKQFRASG